MIVTTWARQAVHNLWGIANVLDITRWRPLDAGLLAADHPFVTGLDPTTGESIWPHNIVFSTPRRPGDDADDVIVSRVGEHLAGLVSWSVRGAPPSRMPPAILYLHAGVHYAGAWLIFSTFREAIRHYSDPRFAAELVRMVRVERREPITVFREREFDPIEFANFVGFMRCRFPWFSNSNGPGRRVLWGNPSPYPAVNTITGHWMTTVRHIAARRADEAVRPSIPRGAYFRDGPYHGPRDYVLPLERALASFTRWRIGLRGERAGIFFVDKRRLDAGWRFRGNSFVSPRGRP